MEFEKWRIAGKLAGQALEYGKGFIVEGAKLLDVAQEIETFIHYKGGKLAFPLNISKNNLAAHYTPLPNDEMRFEKGDIVKLDVGVHIDGYIGDNALTIEVGTNNYSDLIEASKNAWENVANMLKPGIKVCEIGRVIEETILSYGLQPIRNLSGHSVERWTVHAGLSIPNYDNGDETILEEGMVIAVEPFACDDSSMIREGKGSSIYKITVPGNVRERGTKEVLNYLVREYKGLPFSKRALVEKFSLFRAQNAIKNLLQTGTIKEYAQLSALKGVVSQYENTFYITKDGNVVLTDPTLKR